jgi:hypothetical protein
MSKPKHPGGRPRRHAWSAHDARRIARRIEIVHGETRFLAALLQEQPALVSVMERAVPGALHDFVELQPQWLSALRELRAVVLSDTAATWDADHA